MTAIPRAAARNCSGCWKARAYGSYRGNRMKQAMIAVAVAAVYLILSLLTDGWAWTWIIWIFYGIYRITDMVKKSNDE